MPTKKRKDETRDDFIKRCMREISDEFPDNSQRYAVCISYADKSDEKMRKQELYVITPRKAENRGQYLKRCSSNQKMREQFKDLKERLGFCLSSFNEYYKYWTKIEEFAEVPANTALGTCIAKKKSQGLDYKEAYAQCASKVVVPNAPVNLGEDNLLIEPVEFSDISIDFDDTLSTEKGQKLAQKLLDQGNTLHIITRRSSSESSDVYEIADKLGISRDDIHFTNGKLKWEMIKSLGIETHIDNNPDELKAILENLKNVKVVQFGLEDACWEGYEPIGLKPNGEGRMVPNCIPIKEEE